MSTRKRISRFALPLLLVAACGGDEPKKPAVTRIIEEPQPKEAVAEVKLQNEAFRDYYYCEKSYPQTCDDVLKQAYVMPREMDEPFRIVFFNNQDPMSTTATFDYVTIDMDTGEITVEGRFEMGYDVVTTAIKKTGEPRWGIPE